MVVTLLAVKEDVTVAAELPLQLPMCLGYDLMDDFTCKISRLKFQITLPRIKYNTQKNGPVSILNLRPSKLSQLPKSKGIFEKENLKQFNSSSQISTWTDMDRTRDTFLGKVSNRPFIIINKKSFGKKNF